MMTRRLWRVLALAAAIGIYAVIASLHARQSPNLPLSSHAVFFVHLLLIGFLLVMGLALYHVSFRDWVLLIAAFVPFEMSSGYGFLPSLSMIDYFCAAMLPVWLLKQEERSLLGAISKNIGWPACVAWGAFLAYGIYDAAHMNGQARAVMRWGEFIFGYWLACSIPAEERPAAGRDLARLLCGLGSLLAAMALAQFAISGGNYTKAYGTFHQNNGLAAYLSFCLPSSFFLASISTSRARFWLYSAAFMILSAFLVSFSRGAWMGLLVGSAIVFFFSRKARGALPIKKRHLLIAGGVILAFLLIQLRGPYGRRIWKDNGRIIYFQTGARMIRDNPVWGIGPGNYERVIRDYLDNQWLRLYNEQLALLHRLDFWQHLHNVYLQVMVDYGLAGFGLWALALGSMLWPTFRDFSDVSQMRRTIKPYFLISGLAFLAHNFVDILFVSSMDLLFIFLVSLSRREPGDEKEAAG